MTSIVEKEEDISVQPPTPLKAWEMRSLITRIHTMREEEQKQIFRLIEKETTKYTKNLNGVFINLAHLETVTLRKLERLVEFLEGQTRNIDESNKKLREIREETGDSVASDGRLNRSQATEEVTEYLGTLNLYDAVEETVPSACLQELDTHANLLSLDQRNRKRDLALNKAKPRFSGTCARIARKCQGEEGESGGVASNSGVVKGDKMVIEDDA